MMLEVAFLSLILDPGMLADVGGAALEAGAAVAGMAAPVAERMYDSAPSMPSAPDPGAGCDCDCLFGGGGSSLVEAFGGGDDGGDGDGDGD